MEFGINVSKSGVQQYQGFEVPSADLYILGKMIPEFEAVKSTFIIENAYGSIGNKIFVVDPYFVVWGDEGAKALALYHGINLAISYGIKKLNIYYKDFDVLKNILIGVPDATQYAASVSNIINYGSAYISITFSEICNENEYFEQLQEMLG